MSIFDQIGHAFQPVGHAIQNFDPNQAANAIENAIKQHIIDEVKGKIPGHIDFHEAVEVVQLAQPDFIWVDLFAGFGVSIGVELDLEFHMAAKWNKPVQVVGGLIKIVEEPPETVHQLMDRMWSIVPAEITVYQQIQAVVGEQAGIGWEGDQVMERVCKYLDAKGWLEHKLRP